MSNEIINLLLIEDNPGDALLVGEMLADNEGFHFKLTHAEQLSIGLRHLTEEQFDLILLDLSLPDSQGLETFKVLYAHAGGVPVIVLTGYEDETEAVASMRGGAQDYLVKGQTDAGLLIRAIRYAIERSGLVAALLAERHKKQDEAENHLFKRFSGLYPQSVTAQLFGVGPLRETLPDKFEELAVRYNEILDRYLETQTYKVDYNLSEALRKMGDDLGFLKALPRDIIEIHTSVLKEKHKRVSPKKYMACAEEGRLMLIEIMGFLAAYYRRYALGGR